MIKPYKNIIFDLGDVLIKLNFPYWLRTMQDKNINITSSRYDYYYNNYHLPFSKGLIEPDKFEGIYREYLEDDKISVLDIKKIHNSLFVDGYTKSAELLTELASKYDLYVLSNTDPWHIEFLEKTIPGYQMVFKKKVYSYQTKSVKPDKEIYDSFQTITGINYSETIYFDDNKQNIEMGNSLGITSILVTGENQLYEYIKNNLL